MKTATLLLFISLTGFYGNAQNKTTAKADGLYDTYQYVDAINAYLELVKNKKANAYVYRRLGDSYYNVFNTKEAVNWYEKAVESKQDAEVYFRYATSLKNLGRYEEANRQMEIFAKMLPNDQRAKAHLANPNYIPKLADKDKLFEVEDNKVSSRGQSDFAPLLANDGNLYFVSSRGIQSKEAQKANETYIDVYQAQMQPDGSFSRPVSVGALNTDFHDGPVTISADGNTMIFARDGRSGGQFQRDKKNNVKIGQQLLYKATKQGDSWGDIQELPFNNKNYSITHPSLSTDGKTLYFSSNMPGGQGDSDIWKVTVNGDHYGKPQNLGPLVNTAGKEGFPCIVDNHILYFSSNGKQGFGGFDVFKVDLDAKDEAINLGAPVNTETDDFSFSLNTTKNLGYFASNRNGSDNIYTAIPICHSEVIASVTDAKTNTILSGAEVTILDNLNNIIATQQTDAKGTTSFNTECRTSYILNVSKSGYETATFPVKELSEGSLKITTPLKPMEVEVTATEVKLKNIYFEFNESNITQQGAEELDKLVTVMNQRPELNILIKSHTDSKGSAEYNQKLSERRAQATMQYVISKGIKKERLSAEGVGSSQPLVDCQPNCTEEQDAQNRRSEFLIVN